MNIGQRLLFYILGFLVLALMALGVAAALVWRGYYEIKIRFSPEKKIFF